MQHLCRRRHSLRTAIYLGGKGNQRDSKHFRTDNRAAHKPSQVLSHCHLRSRRRSAGNCVHPRLSSADISNQVSGAAAQYQINPESTLPVPSTSCRQEATTEPRFANGEKWKVGLGKVGPTGGSHLRHDGRKSSHLGKERDRRHLQAILLGREGPVSQRKVHGCLESLLQAEGARWTWDQRSEASRFRPTNALAVAAENRSRSGVEPAADPYLQGGPSILQSVNLHQARRREKHFVLGRPVD